MTARTVTTTPGQTPHTSTSTVSATVPAPAPSTSTGIGGGVQQSYIDTNLELATKSVNNVGESIDCDIMEMEAEVAAMAVEVSDSHAADFKEICVRIKEQVLGEFARAGEKLARLDLGKRTTVLVAMDQTT